MQMNVGILTSGNLGYTTIKELVKDFKIEFIATDKNSLSIISFAKEKKIPVFIGNPRESRLINFINSGSFSNDLYFSINYLFLLDEDVLTKPTRYCLNIHGSLLPKYRGRTPHVWAIINDEKQTGLTIHKVDVGCDTGPIMFQEFVEISNTDTGNDILNKFHDLYPVVVSRAIRNSFTNNVSFINQDEKLATYFGKRTPEDGEINWGWYQRRIYNWVRAQSSPYPGAFTFTDNGIKLIIDKVVPFEASYDEYNENGLILDIFNNKPVVKTPNGPLLVSSIREKNINLYNLNGTILGNENR